MNLGLNITRQSILRQKTKRIPMSTENSNRRLMRVRWFDRRKGYGFLVPTNQALESDTQEETVFVYHNQLRTMYMQNIFRMLYTGEYVECELGQDDQNRTVANNVTGVSDGPLMCEVREMNRQSHDEDNDENDEGNYQHRAPRAPREGGRGGGRGRGGGGRGGRGRDGGRGGRGVGSRQHRVPDTSGMDA